MTDRNNSSRLLIYYLENSLCRALCLYLPWFYIPWEIFKHRGAGNGYILFSVPSHIPLYWVVKIYFIFWALTLWPLQWRCIRRDSSLPGEAHVFPGTWQRKKSIVVQCERSAKYKGHSKRLGGKGNLPGEAWTEAYEWGGDSNQNRKDKGKPAYGQKREHQNLRLAHVKIISCL